MTNHIHIEVGDGLITIQVNGQIVAETRQQDETSGLTDTDRRWIHTILESRLLNI